MAGDGTREPGLPETLPALLVSEACNAGLTPVAGETRPALSRARLNWVAHLPGARPPTPLRTPGYHRAVLTRRVPHHKISLWRVLGLPWLHPR